MGQKSKADQLGLKEIIAEKWDGGKKTIVFVTDEVNDYLQKNGYKVTISREGIRRAIRAYEDEVADVRKGIDIAKAMAEVFKDHPGTEASEAMLMQLSHLVTKELRSIESINFEDPSDMIHAAAKLAESQMKLSNYRTKAVTAFKKAQDKLKEELQKAIQSDPELLERLCMIVDSIEVK